MRFWDPADPAIAAADAEPWDGPLSGAMRPVSIRVLTRLYVAGTALAVQSGIAAFVMSYVAEEEIAHPIVLRILGVLLLGMSLVLPAGLTALTASTFRRQAPLTGTAIVMSMGLASTLGIWAAGPEFAFVVVFYFEALPFAFYVFRLPWALLAAVNAAVGCGLVLFLQDGWREPVLTWLVVVTTLVAMAWILGFFAERAEALAESEHEARLELAEVNHTLEDRVASQVTEIERLGELRRFLTPQVADAVMSADAEAITRPAPDVGSRCSSATCADSRRSRTTRSPRRSSRTSTSTTGPSARCSNGTARRSVGTPATGSWPTWVTRSRTRSRRR